MIKCMKIQNFRCLKNIELTFEPLTIIVGPNASGKSTILDVLNPARQNPNMRQDFWKYDESLTISIEITFTDQTKNLYKNARGQKFPPREEKSYRYQALHLDLAHLRNQNQLARASELNKVGDNLPNVFATLTRKQQIELSTQLCDIIPVFSDIDNIPLSGGRHTLRFQDRWDPSVWYLPEQVSDGTMLITAFLLLQFQENPVEVLVIEEPDRGLHPYLLEQMLVVLRRISKGEFGKKPVQVVLATHSVELVNFAEPSEVRFISRNMSDGATRVLTIAEDTPAWKEAICEYQESLGEIWLSGSLGGV